MNKWEKEDKDVVKYSLDEYHNLYIKKTKTGITLQMWDMRGRPHSPNKPIELYVRRITHKELGLWKQEDNQQ